MSSYLKCRTALIIGVNGQDGKLLAKSLFDRGWKVIGLGRQDQPVDWVKPYISEYYCLNLQEINLIEKFLLNITVDTVFYTAAVHGAEGFNYEQVWLESHKVNTICVHAVLEHARCISPNMKLVYFSSGKLFSQPERQIINESSPIVTNSIYTITKHSAHELIKYYRERHNISASVVWLFNHESEFRAPEYFIMRVLEALKRGLKGRTEIVTLESLDFWCDWGSAKEYMEIVSSECDRFIGNEFILATGKTVWARDIVLDLFRDNGLNIDNHIRTKFRSEKSERSRWEIDNTKLYQITGVSPKLAGLDVFKLVYSHL